MLRLCSVFEPADGALAARRARCPLVVTLHCSLHHTMAGADRRPLTVLGPHLESLVLRHADAVVVLTPMAADALIGERRQRSTDSRHPVRL